MTRAAARLRVARLGFAPAFAIVFASSIARAQTPPDAPKTIAIGDFTLAPTLELRTRAEYRHDPVDMGGLDAAGQPNPRVRDPWLIFERSRLGLGAERGAQGERVDVLVVEGQRADGTGELPNHPARPALVETLDVTTLITTFLNGTGANVAKTVAQ